MPNDIVKLKNQEVELHINFLELKELVISEKWEIFSDAKPYGIFYYLKTEKKVIFLISPKIFNLLRHEKPIANVPNQFCPTPNTTIDNQL